MFPGFLGVFSFLKVFHVEWEHWFKIQCIETAAIDNRSINSAETHETLVILLGLTMEFLWCLKGISLTPSITLSKLWFIWLLRNMIPCYWELSVVAMYWSANQLKDKLKPFSLNYFNNFCAATIYIHIFVSNQCYISYYKLVSMPMSFSSKVCLGGNYSSGLRRCTTKRTWQNLWKIVTSWGYFWRGWVQRICNLPYVDDMEYTRNEHWHQIVCHVFPTDLTLTDQHLSRQNNLACYNLLFNIISLNRKYAASLLPPANEVCEGYVFAPVCQSFCSRGEYLGRYTPGQVHHPRQCMLGYGKQADGTHPSGMHSCCKLYFGNNRPNQRLKTTCRNFSKFLLF